MSDHRKQRVTVGDLLDVRAGDMPSIVPPERRRQLLARINASDRQLVDESSWDSDRHAVDDVRLLSDEEIAGGDLALHLADDRVLAQPVDAETLDLSGPGVEETADLPRWSQRDVARWADVTFGPSPSNARIAARANEEMAELLRALTCDDNEPKAIEEAADVVIVLYRLVERMGGDLMQAIDAKMAVNRDRKWLVSGGHGQHVRTREG